MPTREEMRSLAEEIVGSYADRIAAIAQLKPAEAERKRTEAREIAQRKSDVGTMLKEFDKEHAAMSQELKADLSKVAPAIKQAEGERKRTETREISQRKSDVSTMLKEFDNAHAAMSQELKADLSKVAPAIKQAEGERKQTEAREIAQRKSDVSTMLKGFDDSHAAMSQELKADLAKVAPALREAEAGRKQTEAREIAQRKSDVSTMLREFDEEQAGARDEWQILTATMQAQRAGAAVEMGPAEAVAAPAMEITEEKAAEITPETADIRDQIFEYLANHPDGTKMTGLEEEFGLARIQIAKIVKSLMDENKVEKRELFYFAI